MLWASIYSVILTGVRLGDAHYLVALLNACAAIFWGYMAWVLLVRPFSSLRVTLLAVAAWLGTGAVLRVAYGIWHDQQSSVNLGVVLLVLAVALGILVLYETRAARRLPPQLAAEAEGFPPIVRPSSRLATVTFRDGEISNVAVYGGGYVSLPKNADFDARRAVAVAPGGEPTIVKLSDPAPDREAAVVSIVREPAWPASRVNFEVILDGESVASIPEGGEVCLEVTPAPHRLALTIGRFARSSQTEFELAPGQTARFVCRSRFNPVPRPTGYIRLRRTA